MTAEKHQSDPSQPEDRATASLPAEALTVSDVSANFAELLEKVEAEAGIEPEKARQIVRIVRERMAAYSGPIPHPELLEAYNRLSPGLGTKLAEDHLIQQEHDRQCDREAIQLAKCDSTRKDGWLRYAGRGQALGFVSQIIFVCAALWCVYLKYFILAGAFVAPPALGVVGQFIKGTMFDSPAAKNSEQPRDEEEGEKDQ